MRCNIGKRLGQVGAPRMYLFKWNQEVIRVVLVLGELRAPL